jgi:hypothetical protein
MNRLGKEVFEKSLRDSGLRILKTCIEVTFERDKRSFDAGIGCRRIGRALGSKQRRCFREQDTAEKRFHEIAPG